jgi:hypothetical protein
MKLYSIIAESHGGVIDLAEETLEKVFADDATHALKLFQIQRPDMRWSEDNKCLYWGARKVFARREFK